jgi:hypothetical protein
MVILFISYGPRIIFVGWRDFSNLPVSIKGDLEVASDWWLWKYASLRLVCSSNGYLK